MIPVTVVLSMFLFGIEELATQLEEPFTILPMQAFCDKIYNWCNEIMTFAPGDNGFQTKPVKPQHAYFSSGSPALSQKPNTFAPAQPAAVEASAQAQAPAAAADTGMQSFDDFLKSQGQGQ